MYPSSALCRAQEAVQRERATSTPLPNVRTIAWQAAAAWGLEARLAEKRERRREATRMISLGLEQEKQQRRDNEEQGLSENPDRGFAGAGFGWPDPDAAP